MAFLFSVQDFEGTLNSTYDQPILQILVDIFGESGALVLFSLIMGKMNIQIQINDCPILTPQPSLRLALWPF